MAPHKDPLITGASAAKNLIDHDSAIQRLEAKLKERKAAREKVIAGLSAEEREIVKRLLGETVSEKAKA